MVRKLIKLALILTNLKYVKALAMGVAAGVEHEKLLRNLKCRVVVDVGANRGQFSIVADACHPGTKLYSFEPLPEPAQIFKRVFRNNDNVELFECAVGPEEKDAKIHISGRDDSSSLYPITELQDKIFPGTAERRESVVKVKPLESVLDGAKLESPSLLKIDVQGYELEVLKGSDLLLDSFDYIYVECSFVELYKGQALAKDVISFLASRSFELGGVYNISLDSDGNAVQGDFLFLRN